MIALFTQCVFVLFLRHLPSAASNCFSVTNFKVKDIDVELGVGYGFTPGLDRLVVKASSVTRFLFQPRQRQRSSAHFHEHGCIGAAVPKHPAHQIRRPSRTAPRQERSNITHGPTAPLGQEPKIPAHGRLTLKQLSTVSERRARSYGLLAFIHAAGFFAFSCEPVCGLGTLHIYRC